jgi:hypothetical protein
VTNGLQQVGLAKTRATIQEQWIILLAWMVGYLLRGSKRKLICRPDDKGLKSIAWVKIVRFLAVRSSLRSRVY